MLPLAAAALLIPLACFGVLAIWGDLRRSGLWAGVFSALGAVVSLVCASLALVAALTNPKTSEIFTVPWLTAGGETMAVLGVRADGISIPMLFTVTLVATCVQIYSLGYMADEDKPGIGRYFAWQSLFLFSMLSLVLAPDLLQAFLGWELVGLCSYLLIGFYYRKPSAARAAVKAFWVTKFADIGFLLAIVLLFVRTGSFSWDVAEGAGFVPWVAFFLFVGAMGKSAQFPLHVWLPDAMEGPTPVSALLHAATMVAAGVYLVVRSYPLFEAAPTVLTMVAWIGSITAFLAACIALVQHDIKKVLAYSTCSQLGYMMASLGSGSLMAGYFHLTTHAFFKALLFLGAGAAIHAVHSNSIFDMGGLWRTRRPTSLLFIIGTLALMGIPGFSGFFSKDYVLEAMEHGHQWGPFALCFVGVGLTAFYMGRVLFIAYGGEPSAHARHAEEHGHPTPATMAMPMALLAVLALGGGIAGPALARLTGEHYAFHLTPAGIGATGVGLFGLGLAWLRYGRKTLGEGTFAFLAPLGAFIRSGPMDRFYETLWQRGLLVLAGAIGYFDRYVIDGLMNLFGIAALRGGDLARRTQTGRAPDYVMAVLVGFILLAAFSALAGDGSCPFLPGGDR